MSTTVRTAAHRTHAPASSSAPAKSAGVNFEALTLKGMSQKPGMNELRFSAGPGKAVIVGWNPKSGALTVKQQVGERTARPLQAAEQSSLLKAIYGQPALIGLVSTLESKLAGGPTR